MKLSAIALDFDGTIAEGDVLAPSIRDAIAFAPSRGIVVAALVGELRRRGVPCARGPCLVDADANEAPRILDVIRSVELPLVLLFNRSRVMTMKQGISKATGLGAALATLRLSAHNTLAVGDAESDHEMLRLAEVGAAVAWGSAALKAAADVVVDEHGPAAVGDYVRALAAAATLPLPPRGRRRLLLGYREDGAELSLAVRGRNVLLTGDVKSGKSWVAGLLCEQLILHGYCVCVLDPEGDYSSLEALPSVTVLGRDDAPPTPRELLRALRYPDRSAVIDLSRLPHELLNSTEVMIVTCESNPVEVDALRARCGGCRAADASGWRAIGRLKVGEALVLPITEESGGQMQRFSIAPRLTPHVRHREKYVDVPVSSRRAFVFNGNGRSERRVHTLRQFVCELEHTPQAQLGAYIARGDFSRWIGDVFGDLALATELRRLELQYGSRPRQDVLMEMANAVRGRYDLASDRLDSEAAPGPETPAADPWDDRHEMSRERDAAPG